MTDPITSLNAALEGRYLIDRQIGQGGMATVYLARDVRHDRQVAIKILHPELAAVLGPERFITEMRVTANLQHPHILPLFDSGSATGQLFYVMPYVEGESLRTRLTREQQLPIETALRLTTEIAGALDYAHRKGVVHRDIKPENILLHDGSALVADFGIALAVSNAGGARLTQTGLSLGTPQYMSPEQATGDRHVDGRTDVYSLACVLYEMLVGEPPFTGPSSQAIVAQVLTENVRSMRSRRGTIPAGVESAVLKALQKLPADRYPTPQAFAVSLAEQAPASSPPTPVARRRLRAGVSLFAVVLATAAFVAGKASNTGAVSRHYRGSILDGPAVAFTPKLSPDGKTVAFAGMVAGQTQLGVLNPVTGDWRMLTQDTTLGAISNLAWSPDGNRIYYTRSPDVAVGTYSISPLGGDNRLVFPNASIAAVLSNGSLILTRIGAKQREGFLLFDPRTGTTDTLPGGGNYGVFYSTAHVLPGEKEFLFQGSLSDAGGLDSLYAINISTKAARLITAGMKTMESFCVTPDGSALIIADRDGDQTNVIRMELAQPRVRTILFSVPHHVYAMSVSRDGDVLIDQYSRPHYVFRYNATTSRVDAAATPGYWTGSWLLPDGRMVVPRRSGGKTRAVLTSRSGETTQLLASNESVLSPVIGLGNDRLMVRVETDSSPVLTITNFVTGQPAGRIPGFHPEQFAGSPDGTTIFYADSGSIWSMPVTGSPRRRLHEGSAVAVDPLGRYLIIMINRADRAQLVRYNLADGSVSEIQGRGPATNIGARALSADGRLVMPVSSPASWNWLLGVLDTKTGDLTIRPFDYDVWDASWDHEGNILVTASGISSLIWRFRPGS